MTLFKTSSVAFLTFLAQPLMAAPLITEFVASNRNSLVDGDGRASDWIEIYNPDGETLDLSGYHLTDDPEVPTKYTFPDGTMVSSGEYLVVFASGQVDSTYTDAGGNLHTNFSLNAGGEYLALNAPGGATLQEFAPKFVKQFEDISFGIGAATPSIAMIDEGAPTRWLVPESDLGASWQEPGFDDSGWTEAETAIGYGYDDLVGANGDVRSAMWFINSTIYLRLPFQVDDPSDFSSLLLRMRYEDGFVAYLNGERIASGNAPDEASLTHTSNATATHPDSEAIVPVEFTIGTGALVAGKNILAIHGLNFTTSGSNSSDFLAFPELLAAGVSETVVTGYFPTPTPGSANQGDPFIDYVRDTKFSVDRGYHTEAFEVEITSTTVDNTIIFTTDGTEPTLENGTTYTAPIPISESTTLRARAFKEGFLSSNTDTQTYLFVADIVRQTRPTGYPTSWGGGNADYAMDPEIVDDPAYADKFEEAFAALPTLSLVFDPDSFFHPSTGIYQRPQSQGINWERAASAEFMVPDGSEPGFQIDAGVRIQGGSSRSTDTPKHSLSLRFRSDYGAAKLKYPLFENSPVGESAVDEFDALQLRPEYNFGWMHRHWYQADHALYGRDQWASDLFLKMGQNGSHGRWMHLFLNGIYWGLYDVHERPDADHMANYFGGKDDDYDTVNSSVATNGDLNAYNAMMNLAYGPIQTTATYEAIQEYLDLDSFIDYMMLNAYVGNRDWDGHNWRAARKREAGAPYLFFPWDTEFAVSHLAGGVFPSPPNFFTTSLNTNVTTKNGNRRPTGLQRRLALNEEYRLRYADRVRSYMFNEGPLTPMSSSTTWTDRSVDMTAAIVAESARWGDFRRDVNSSRWTPAQFDLYTRDDHYLPMNDWLINTYIPQRTDIVLNQLKARNLYPSLDAPDFSIHGGRVLQGTEIRIDAPETIYYTIDGTDPREAGGAANAMAVSLAPGSSILITQSLQLQSRTRSAGGQWSALTKADFTVGVDNLLLSEIMYQPESNGLSEFLEIFNPGTFEISLAGLTFTDGISFDFDSHSNLSTIPSGGRLLIVRDLPAFQDTYGNAHDGIIAGVFQEDSKLSNDGETITLEDAGGSEVFSVTYNDAPPWPAEADGSGRSLIFKGSTLHAAENWRASASKEGNPGSSDATPYQGGSLLDYALAGPMEISGDESSATVIIATKLTADDVNLAVEYSSDLQTWAPIIPILKSQTISTEGSRLISFEIAPGIGGFARVSVTLK